MFDLKGVYPAMLTPFNDDLTINEGEVRRLVDHHIANGLDGLFPVSSVGEGVHMTREEKMRYMEIVVDQAKGRVPVTPGIVASYPEECIRLAHKAAELGCSAVVVTPPYFYRPNEAMVEQFFTTIAEKAGLPLILYNIPLFTQPLSYALIERLSKDKRIVGIKDSSGSMVDFLHIRDLTQKAGSNVSCFTGREEMLLPCLFMGAKGCMTAASAVLPEVMSGIYDRYEAGDLAKARQLQEAVLEPIRLMFGLALPAGFKLGLSLRGFKMGPTRLPMAQSDIATADALKPLLKASLEKALSLVGAPLLA